MLMYHYFLNLVLHQFQAIISLDRYQAICEIFMVLLGKFIYKIPNNIEKLSTLYFARSLDF